MRITKRYLRHALQTTLTALSACDPKHDYTKTYLEGQKAVYEELYYLKTNDIKHISLKGLIKYIKG